MTTAFIPKETLPGETRVAAVPDTVRRLVKAGLEIQVQAGAGRAAYVPDEQYEAEGARIVGTEAWGQADLVLKVQPPTVEEAGRLKQGTVLVAYAQAGDNLPAVEKLRDSGVTMLAMELIPRITRAQSMDALSSQSTLAGYEAVLLAAAALPRIFPMMVTAAGTLQPSKLLVVGAGVAGLQALGTAKRLGAVTFAYDTRPVVREQVESIGARFVELDLSTEDAEDAGGYATEQSEEFYQRQRALLGEHVAASDVVITTALVPGQQAPLLIEESAVKAMRPGSVIVDLAAEKGGNCACTEPEAEVVVHGVTVIGWTNLPARVPAHASQMYGRNVTTFLAHLIEEGELKFELEDEITRGTLVTHQGQVVHERIRALIDDSGAGPGSDR